MSFKVIGDFENHYMVMHPDGSSFPIAKKGISEDLHKKIKGMQEPVKMSDGGIFQPEQMTEMSQPTRLDPSQLSQSSPAPADSSPWATPQQSAPLGAFASYFGASDPASAPPGPGSAIPSPGPTPNPAIPFTPGPPVASNAPMGNTGMMSPELSGKTSGVSGSWDEPSKTPPKPTDPFASMPGMSQQMAGIQGMAKATGDYQNQAAKVYDNQEQQLKETHQLYQSKLHEADQKVQAISNDVMNGKVEPSRVWNSMGTGSKITAAIAVALGGIGAGLTGKSNAAMDVINKSIDNDIESQKIDLGKKNTLLGHYMAQYNNIEQAENAAKLHLTAIAGAQLQKYAAQSGGAQAKAQAQLLTGQLKSQAAPMLAKQGLNDLYRQMSGGNGGEGGLSQEDEAKLQPMLTANDKEYTAKRVTVNGRVYQHTGVGSDAEKMRVFEAKLGPITAAVQELDKLGPSAAIQGTKEYETAHSIRAGLATNIAGLKSQEIGSSKINGEEAERALEQINDPSSFKQLLSSGIRNLEFLKDLNRTAESVRKQSLIGYKGRPQTFEMGQKK